MEVSLLRTRRFFPLFITQFLGAFNDNVYKNSLVILITYTLAAHSPIKTDVLITIAAGIFILPFFLFSALAGQLADKYEKSRLIRQTKIAEVLLMSLVSIGFYFHHLFLLLFVLFLAGTQAAFFGPLKYAILPEHLKTNELVAGNAWIEAGTFLAILLGTILGGILASISSGPFWIAMVVVLFAALGLWSSFFIPRSQPAAPQLKIRWNIIDETWRMIRDCFQHPRIRSALLGISWFWLIGATYLSQFPTYTKKIVGAEASVVTLFLACFTAGIGMGSWVCSRLLKGDIKTTYVPIAALGMTLFSIDFVIASQHTVLHTSHLLTFREFFSFVPHWRILVDLLGLSVSGGIYIVPLYVVLQFESLPENRSRVIACNNILNAFFMVMAAVLTSVMLQWHFSVTQLFLLIAICNLLMIPLFTRCQ